MRLVHAVRSLIAKFRIVFGQIANVLECNVRAFWGSLGFEIGIQVVHGGKSALIDLQQRRRGKICGWTNGNNVIAVLVWVYFVFLNGVWTGWWRVDLRKVGASTSGADCVHECDVLIEEHTERGSVAWRRG